jgi:hypothetical protein
MRLRRLNNIVLGEADPPCQKTANADIKSVEGFRRWSIGGLESRISIHDRYSLITVHDYWSIRVTYRPTAYFDLKRLQCVPV